MTSKSTINIKQTKVLKSVKVLQDIMKQNQKAKKNKYSDRLIPFIFCPYKN